jgi:hypothetical protein
MARLMSGRPDHRRVAAFVAPFQLEPGWNVRLAKDFDPASKGGVTNK